MLAASRRRARLFLQAFGAPTVTRFAWFRRLIRLRTRVRIRVGRVPDLMRFALCRTNRLKREASATMYVVGALAFAFVEEWNGYPLGSFLFALFVAARECVLSSSPSMRVEVDSQSFGRCVGVPWRLCCVILSYHSSSRLRLLAR